MVLPLKVPEGASGDYRACPLCASSDNHLLLENNSVPVLLNHLADSPHEAARAQVGDLRIVSCADCGFTFNSRFDPSLVKYGERYENDQSFSPRFLEHLFHRVEAVARAVAVSNQFSVLEVGCGQGTFLESLLTIAPAGRAVGYDSAWRDRPLPSGLHIERAYFDAKAASEHLGAFDACIARHVIEHVSDPLGFLRNSYLALKKDGLLFVETPDLEWILANIQMQDFFYEHCNYFTQTTLSEALSRAGFTVSRIERTFGGQYLWAEALRNTPQEPRAAAPLPAGVMLDGTRMISFFANWRCRLLDERREAGALVVWGAGAKGVTFVNQVDRECQLIDYLVDLNPNKASRFIPVTCHPVLGPDDSLVRIPPRLVVVMNPMYAREIEAMLHMRGLRPVVLAV